MCVGSHVGLESPRWPLGSWFQLMISNLDRSLVINWMALSFQGNASCFCQLLSIFNQDSQSLSFASSFLSSFVCLINFHAAVLLLLLLLLLLLQQFLFLLLFLLLPLLLFHLLLPPFHCLVILFFSFASLSFFLSFLYRPFFPLLFLLLFPPFSLISSISPVFGRAVPLTDYVIFLFWIVVPDWIGNSVAFHTYPTNWVHWNDYIRKSTSSHHTIPQPCTKVNRMWAISENQLLPLLHNNGPLNAYYSTPLVPLWHSAPTATE